MGKVGGFGCFYKFGLNDGWEEDWGIVVCIKYIVFYEEFIISKEEYFWVYLGSKNWWIIDVFIGLELVVFFCVLYI